MGLENVRLENDRHITGSGICRTTLWVACIERYDAGAYSKLQFLRAISHSLGIHSDGFLAEEISDDDENDCVNVDEQQQQQHSGPATSNTAAADATSAKCDVCLVAPRERVVLVL